MNTNKIITIININKVYKTNTELKSTIETNSDK